MKTRSKASADKLADENKGEIVVYQSDDGHIRLEVRLQDETVWLTQQLIAELFQTTVPNISMHIRNIFEEGELTPEATIKKFLTVRREGSRNVQRKLEFYNLDMIISVGYRVKSLIATRFRIWATERLKEYIVKGFTMDDERLKNPPVKGAAVPDYFDEMLERIRDIRASERRVLPNAGNVSRQAAEEHAKAEYEKFEVRRREYKETLGEIETIKQLEQAAKLLGTGRTHNRKKPK
jgi:hypothetical protein